MNVGLRQGAKASDRALCAILYNTMPACFGTAKVGCNEPHPTCVHQVQVGIMERAIEAGESVLIENMAESIDAVLNPIITRSTFKKGRSLYVKLGDKDVEYNPKFRLVLHTKLSNPHYPPEIQAETTLINFTVTETGLEDQLLALTVNKERPDLEATKTDLVRQNTEFTIRLKQLEDDLLMRLSTAEGDLTEDVALIESLEESKRIADDITIKVQFACLVYLKENHKLSHSEKYKGVDWAHNNDEGEKYLLHGFVVVYPSFDDKLMHSTHQNFTSHHVNLAGGRSKGD